MADIDLVRLNFNPQTLLLLNVVLGLVMFGVSLELKPADLRAALATPRALAIECGIQNSGLGLILIFNFFDGLGGMAVVAAWWGIWHIVAGLTLATYWSKKLTGKG